MATNGHCCPRRTHGQVRSRWSLPSLMRHEAHESCPSLSRFERWLALEPNVLSPQHRQLSLVRPDLAGTLTAVVQKLCSGAHVHLAAVGSSVTAGHGLNEGREPKRKGEKGRDLARRWRAWVTERTWPRVLERAIPEVWPRANVTVTNQAIPATSAGFSALCYRSLLRSAVDLLLVEYSLTTQRESDMLALLNMAQAHGTAVLVVDYASPLADPAQYSTLCRAPALIRAGRPQCHLSLSELVRSADAPHEVPFLELYTRRSVPVVTTGFAPSLFRRSGTEPLGAKGADARASRPLRGCGSWPSAQCTANGTIGALDGLLASDGTHAGGDGQ